MKKLAKLVLENGTVLSGKVFGAMGEVSGEICFNTGMTGYQEILTDPSYCGQLIIMTYPHIGNYGINEEDFESKKIQASGLIIRQESIIPSNFRSSNTLSNFLKKNNIIGIQEIDTRMLTKIIRTEGAMNSIISTFDLENNSLLNKVQKIPSMNGMDLAKIVSTKRKYTWGLNKKIKYNIAAIDFGIKENILRLLESHKCQTTVYPANVTATDILKNNPDAIFLSNGPGDPAAVKYAIHTVKNLLGKKPIFGICLGHQILALALGAKTYKLKFGHRGCNHPVKNLLTNKTEITSQNHGFSVEPKSIPKNVEITHISLNDSTIEGIRCKEKFAFSVQFHPESSPGPHDSRYLFKEFINMIKKIHAKT